MKEGGSKTGPGRRRKSSLGTLTLESGNNGKEMYKKSVVHVQSCCFANQTYCFFAVLVAVRVVVALSSLIS